MSRRFAYRVAVTLHALLGLYSVVSAFPMLLQGPPPVDSTPAIPQFVLVLASLLGVVSLVSAYGAWRVQKWGIWLTIGVSVLGGLLAAPGVLVGPTPDARISATVGMVIAAYVALAMLSRPVAR